MAFEELKERHAVMWGAAPFERIAWTLAEMHDALVDAVAAGPGESWLDAGCGTGELAFRAVETGATITGCDLSPALIETARRQAAERGLEISFDVAGCESLPYADESFDVVTSSVGIIFAPDHPRVAAELKRVLRPGGRLAFTAWMAEGRAGEFLRLLASYSPPPVDGAGIPMQWSDAAYARELLGDAFELDFEYSNTPWTGESADEMWDEFSTSFGPIAMLLAALEPDRAAALRADSIALLETTDDDGRVAFDRPYVLVRGTRR